jgi:ribonucleotide monophosphatase NagD (HAD superfamily)
MTHVLSPLNKAWIFDIDGTIVKHNGYKTDGYDTLLNGAKEFFAGISEKDLVVLITSRTKEHKELTERFLTDNDIRFDAVIYNAPFGERILVNDAKPSGLPMTLAVDTQRDKFMTDKFEVNNNL